MSGGHAVSTGSDSDRVALCQPNCNFGD